MVNFYATSFFFQAEDGIRDADVTGVQTCALPISQLSQNDQINLCFNGNAFQCSFIQSSINGVLTPWAVNGTINQRSEERRVGKECRAGCAPQAYIKNRECR